MKKIKGKENKAGGQDQSPVAHSDNERFMKRGEQKPLSRRQRNRKREERRRSAVKYFHAAVQF
jgi:hypothetical protein